MSGFHDKAACFSAWANSGLEDENVPAMLLSDDHFSIDQLRRFVAIMLTPSMDEHEEVLATAVWRECVQQTDLFEIEALDKETLVHLILCLATADLFRQPGIGLLLDTELYAEPHAGQLEFIFANGKFAQMLS